MTARRIQISTRSVVIPRQRRGSAAACCALISLVAGCSPPTVDARLPAAAVVEPTPPPSAASSTPASTPSESLADRLARISVRTRFPPLAGAQDERPSPTHVALALVEQAIEHAEADMFVSYMANGGETFPAFQYELLDDGAFVNYPNDPNSDVSSGALTGYGLATHFGYSPSSSAYVLSVRYELAPLAERTPGLVWEVAASGRTYALFVSVDGETYTVDLEREGPVLEPGVDPVEKWPPLANPAFGRFAFVTTRREAKAPLAPADDAFHQCAEKAWSRAQKRARPKETDTEPMPSGAVVRTACAKEIAAWERTLAENIDASVARRTALLERAKERLSSPAGGG